MTLRPLLVPALLCSLISTPAAGQQRAAWPSPPAPAAPANAIEEGPLTGLGVLAAALVAPSDARVRAWAVATPRPLPGIAQLDAIFKPMGGPMPLVAASGTWLAGHLMHEDEVATGGLIAAESIAATMLAKGVIQRLLGRSRPADEPHDPWDFGIGRGIGMRSRRSFPSGHAANSFALAAAVHEELHHVGSPASPWVSGFLYGAASITSFSRVMDDQHWLSDVVGGAVLGGVIGALVADANDR